MREPISVSCRDRFDAADWDREIRSECNHLDATRFANAQMNSHQCRGSSSPIEARHGALDRGNECIVMQRMGCRGGCW
jgi:hypothetical protein